MRCCIAAVGMHQRSFAASLSKPENVDSEHVNSSAGTVRKDGNGESGVGDSDGGLFARWTGKVRGAGEDQPPAPALSASVYAGTLSFFGIGLLSLFQHGSASLGLGGCESTVLIGSFGATAALVYGAPGALFSQPRNVVGGHAVSALTGVAAHQLCGSATPELACPLAVGAAVLVMQQLRVLHPPSAATALIGAMGAGGVAELGIAFPAVAAGGSALLVGIGALVHNLWEDAPTYPRYWW